MIRCYLGMVEHNPNKGAIREDIVSQPIQLQCTPYISLYYLSLQAAYLALQPSKKESPLINAHERHPASQPSDNLRFPRWMTTPARIDMIVESGPLFFSSSNWMLVMIVIYQMAYDAGTNEMVYAYLYLPAYFQVG